VALETKAKYIFTWLLVTSILYFSVQAVVGHNYSFLTPLDSMIPFVPDFVWVYHTLIPVILYTTIFLMQKRRVFFSTVASLTFSMAVLTAFHLFFPSYYPRQELDSSAQATMSVWLVELTREFDAACNTFPSGHVTFSWVIYFSVLESACAKRSKSFRSIYLLWAVGISFSTLLLKQHYIFDVVAGIMLAHASVMIGKELINRYLDNEANSRRRQT
jgi:membrane-associated phospholipid phosphatase